MGAPLLSETLPNLEDLLLLAACKNNKRRTLPEGKMEVPLSWLVWIHQSQCHDQYQVLLSS